MPEITAQKLLDHLLQFKEEGDNLDLIKMRVVFHGREERSFNRPVSQISFDNMGYRILFITEELENGR